MPLLHALDVSRVRRNDTPVRIDRRGFLGFAAASTGLLLAGPALAASPADHERFLSLYAPNTGEILRLVYWIPDAGYVQRSIREISHFLRDHRNDQVKQVDPALLDILYRLQRQLEPRQPIEVLSGYRSPETNALLRQHSRNVAHNSLHLHARAIDIRMPDRDFNDLHRAAVSLQAGGVGRYGRSRFIHIDTGPVRQWG